MPRTDRPWDRGAAPPADSADHPWDRGAAPGPPLPPEGEPEPDPDNPFAFTAPGEMAREHDRKVREREGDTGTDTPTEPFNLHHRILDNGAMGGLFAVFGALIWFVIGLANDIIYFYPPILFIVGLAALIKGITGEE